MAMSHSMWDLSSQTRDGNCVPQWKCGVLCTEPPGKSPISYNFQCLMLIHEGQATQVPHNVKECCRVSHFYKILNNSVNK